MCTRVREPLMSELLRCSLPVEFPQLSKCISIHSAREPLSFGVICCDRRVGKNHSFLKRCQIIVTFSPLFWSQSLYLVFKRNLYFMALGTGLDQFQEIMTVFAAWAFVIAGWRLQLRGASLDSSADEAHEECLLCLVSLSVLYCGGEEGLSFSWLKRTKTDFRFMTSECAGV